MGLGSFRGFTYKLGPPTSVTDLLESEDPDWGRVLVAVACGLLLLVSGWVMLPFSMRHDPYEYSDVERLGGRGQSWRLQDDVTMAQIRALGLAGDLNLPEHAYGKVSIGECCMWVR